MTASNRLRKTFAPGFACLFALTLAAAFCKAQETSTGTITGTVTDTSGAVVPHASVTAVDQNTGIKITTNTNDRGVFAAPGLPIDVYKLVVTKHGFATYSQTDIRLHPGTVTAINPRLQPGSVVSTVTVSATASAVQTSTPEVSSEVAGEQVRTLPLNGRNYQSLSALMPGVLNMTPDTGLGQGGFATSNEMSINGMGTAGSIFYVDGVWNMNSGSNTSVIVPNPDTIQEVRVLQNNYGVQYNFKGASTIFVETKSGTDQFHLLAYDYLRNTAFNARNFFSPTVPGEHQNIFGGTLGGPLFLPGRRPKNPKTFFFASIQAALLSNASVVTGAVPTLTMRNGTFSTPIKNPLTGSAFPNSGGVYQIPQNMLNSNSLALMNATEPLPNYVSPVGGITNYINLDPNYTRTRTDEWKVDHEFSSRVRLMAEYIEDRQLYRAANNTILGSPFTTSQTEEPDEDQLGQVRLTTTISPSMVNTASVATSQTIPTIELSGIQLLSQVPSFSQDLPYKSGYNQQYLPAVSITGGWSSLGGPSNGYPLFHAGSLDDTAADDWSYLRGHHYLQAGIGVDLGTKRQNSFDSANGAWSFSGQFTGNAVADYLIGDAASFTQASSEPRFYAHHYTISPYFQDQWKATRRVSITAGVRWIDMPNTNLQPGYEAIFDPALYSLAAAPVVKSNGTITPTANYSATNGLIFNGVNGVPLNFTNEYWSYWAPSAGFAWDLFGDGKTALRGGYGIVYQDSPYQTNCANPCAANPPLIKTITLVTPTFPNPLGAAVKPASAPNLNSESLGDRSPQIQNFSLSLEHQFAGAWFASITGAGDLARNQTAAVNINQPLPDAPYNFNPVINSGTVFSYLYSPYLGYGSISSVEPSLNTDWYALEVSVRHPVGHNLFLTAAYTWQHDLSEITGTALFNNEAGPQNAYNPSADYGNASMNVPQSLSFSYIWSLPWYQNARGVRGQALGGWRYAGMTTIESGFSQSPSLSIAKPGLATRPDSVGAVPGPKTVTEWFNTAAFAAPAAGYFGNAAPGSIQGPGPVDFDMALYKDFHVTERNTIQFRAEAFNIFNRANFSNVSTAFGSGTYGELTSARDPRIFEFALRYQF
jgi:Carboxypeptidase regulatory-like domain/TonB-dependent Receptor Plug Domain